MENATSVLISFRAMQLICRSLIATGHLEMHKTISKNSLEIYGLLDSNMKSMYGGYGHEQRQ